MSVSMKMQFEKPLHQTLLMQDAALWVAADDALGLGCGAGSARAARPEPGAGILCRDTQGVTPGEAPQSPRPLPAPGARSAWAGASLLHERTSAMTPRQRLPAEAPRTSRGRSRASPPTPLRSSVSGARRHGVF